MIQEFFSPFLWSLLAYTDLQNVLILHNHALFMVLTSSVQMHVHVYAYIFLSDTIAL
jgi:hypothetical protein